MNDIKEHEDHIQTLTEIFTAVALFRLLGEGSMFSVGEVPTQAVQIARKTVEVLYPEEDKKNNAAAPVIPLPDTSGDDIPF